MEKSFLSEYKRSSSLTFLALFNLFLIKFGRWVSTTRIFLFRLFPLLQHQQRVSHKHESLTKQGIEEEEEYDDLCRADIEMVMRTLGLSPDQESDKLQERYSSKEISSLFESNEASLEEVKQAFDVFDEKERRSSTLQSLQRVLTILGFKEGYFLGNCSAMLRSVHENKDGRIDFNGFVKFMENNNSL
ncbi:hypothetical protein HID58_091464 [Brassica napus]|uniref:EF-hand domain-containing protein n=1 Tax=Brassica napus TaxID=3708 RepID=A0ABQ7WZW4_BRANA|nr:probable calcium-binding protein CML45 [Brassica napus]KAH0849220.1 hypothetical protein HID58_091464 [Brassica napus]